MINQGPDRFFPQSIPVSEAIEQARQRVESSRGKLRSALMKQEIDALLDEVGSCWKTAASARGRSAASRFFCDDDNVFCAGDGDESAALCRFNTAAADFFGELLSVLNADQQDAFLGETGAAAARKLSYCFPGHLEPCLLRENELIAGQRQCFRELSLSTQEPCAPAGDVRLLLQSQSRERRSRAYHAFAVHEHKLLSGASERFLELHRLRRQFSEQAGFHSYHEYAVRRFGLTDALRARMLEFRGFVHRHIVPLAAAIREHQRTRLKLERLEPWDMLFPAVFGPPRLSKDMQPLVDTWIGIMRRLFSSNVPRFDTMVGEKTVLLDALSTLPEPSADVSRLTFSGEPGVTAAGLYDPPSLFFSLSRIPQETFAHKLFFMSGVFMLDPFPPVPYEWEMLPLLIARNARSEKEFFASGVRSDFRQTAPDAVPSSFTKMIAGYSFSFLSQRAWRLFYGPMAEYARQYLVSALVFDMVLLCALDEMEEFLARSRVSDPAIFTQVWTEIAGRYDLPGTRDASPGILPAGDLWLFAPSLWEKPLSGIVRALAAISVLGTLPLGKQHIHLEERFALLLKGREEADPLVRPMVAGYPSPFDEETAEKAAFAAADFLAL